MNKIILGILVWLAAMSVITWVTEAHAYTQNDFNHDINRAVEDNRTAINSNAGIGADNQKRSIINEEMIDVVIDAVDTMHNTQQEQIDELLIVVELYREALAILYVDLEEANEKIEYLATILNNASL